MQDYKKTILSTRPVDGQLIQQAASRSILLDIVPFIETEPVLSIEIQQEIELAATELATVVFTSMNAVTAVITMLNDVLPEWRIYCMGHRTKELVEAYFGKDAIAGIAENAGLLAEQIIEEGNTDELIFFCGDQRRNELPDKLEANDITVTEIVVYQTINTPKQLNKSYDAVLFFSPSAVESFFSKNKLAADCIVFAIGATTANTVRSRCSNKIVTGKSPAKNKLVEQAIAALNESVEK